MNLPRSLCLASALLLGMVACNGKSDLDAVLPTASTSGSTGSGTTGGPPPGLGTTGCGVNPYTVLVGSGAAGFSDGSGQSAQLDSPFGLAVDTHGSLYIADSANNAIRKRDSSGNVTTLAGGGQTAIGFIDGAGGVNGPARFRDPAGVAVDAAGNVYVGDYANNAIRKIDTSNNVTTVAGLGPSEPGFADGAASTAQFSAPGGLAVDAAGNVYVADENNNAIRKIDSSGNVTTIAGGHGQQGFKDGTGGINGTAAFFTPIALVLDGSGNLYVAESGNKAVRKIDASGNVTTFAGSGPGSQGLTDGQGTSAVFGGLQGIARDSAGNLYVSDTNNAIRKIDPQANVTTLAGPPCAAVAQPYGLAFNASNLWIAVQSSNEVASVQP